MFENIINFFKKIAKKDKNVSNNSKDTAKERLHLVLMQDRANVSVDFLELMKQEIIDVIKKYIDIDEAAIDVRLTNKENEDGTNGAPALYANIPIINIKNDVRKTEAKKEEKVEEKKETKKIEKSEEKDEIIINKENDIDVNETEIIIDSELNKEENSKKGEEEKKQEDNQESKEENKKENKEEKKENKV